jgi:hypothetical protein
VAEDTCTVGDTTYEFKPRPHYCLDCQHYRQVGPGEHTFARTSHACTVGARVEDSPLGPMTFYADCQVKNADNHCPDFAPLSQGFLGCATLSMVLSAVILGGLTIWGALIFVGLLPLP